MKSKTYSVVLRWLATDALIGQASLFNCRGHQVADIDRVLAVHDWAFGGAQRLTQLWVDRDFVLTPQNDFEVHFGFRPLLCRCLGLRRCSFGSLASRAEIANRPSP